MFLVHGPHLPLDRCPHCQISKPTMTRIWFQRTKDHYGGSERLWGVYTCSSCGGVILAAGPHTGPASSIEDIWPKERSAPQELPTRAREYLSQAIEAIATPAGCIMLAASAVDAMLKERGLSNGTLFNRIDQAAAQHLITSEMALWAHEIRLEANAQRHADESTPLPTSQDAERTLEFAYALAQFMYVLPAKIDRGRKEASPAA